MGRLIKINASQSRSLKSKSLTKGQRLGWIHKSDYQPVSLRSFSSEGKKLSTYSDGLYAINKLVP